MSYFSKKDYQFVKFEKAKNNKKKYSAIIKNKITGRTKKINFGSSAYEHFKDSTGLGIYTRLNHGDKKRKENYKKRHSVYIKTGMYSAGFFSMKYLWT